MPWPNGGCSGKPTLRLTFDDGSAKTLLPADDTHIWAGHPDNVYGDKYLLRVADQGKGPFTAATSKACLRFDLDGLPKVKKAELTLTGKADAGKQVMLFGNGESFDEDTRTWNNTVQYTYSWQGDPGGLDWKRPAGADKEYYVQLPRFSFAGPLAAAAAPRGVLPRIPRGGQVARRRSRLPGGAARRLDLPRRRLLGGDGRRTCARR